MIRRVTADVVIIGGGAAGANAALKARALGLEPLMLVKGFLGRSGGSLLAAFLVMPTPPTHDRRAELDAAVRYYNHYLADEDYILRVQQYARDEFLPELEERGLYIRREENGKIALSPFGSLGIMSPGKYGDAGRLVMDLRRKEVLGQGLRVMEQTMATAIVVRDGEAVGVCALDLVSGQFHAISAKAVILATGHTDQLATRATGTRDQCANGLAMAYRAGAEMRNLEMQWWHVNDMKSPASWSRVQTYPNPLLGTKEVARHYNNRGDMFFDLHAAPGSPAPYTLQLRRLAQQVQQGLARWDGDYYASYSHIDPGPIRKYNLAAEFYEKLGLDVGKDRAECAVTWHMRQGGIHVEPRTMETNVEGLFIAGAVGGHTLGNLVYVSYDGQLAARRSAERARHAKPGPLTEAEVDREAARVFGFLRSEPRGGFQPIELKREIREVMWGHMGYVKSEASMREGLARIERIRREKFPRMRLATTSTRWNRAWIDALDVEDMLLVTEMTIRSSRHRKESRGPFYREDYPVTDHKHWLRHTILRRDEHGEPVISSAPVHLKWVTPPVEREDFFQTDY
jgi:succinate dehydrogenase / fumarate reductase flavoprotein subunit